jgi:hypothetical protein
MPTIQRLDAHIKDVRDVKVIIVVLWRRNRDNKRSEALNTVLDCLHETPGVSLLSLVTLIRCCVSQYDYAVDHVASGHVALARRGSL